jgi:hypothetical protein
MQRHYKRVALWKSVPLARKPATKPLAPTDDRSRYRAASSHLAQAEKTFFSASHTTDVAYTALPAAAVAG